MRQKNVLPKGQRHSSVTAMVKYFLYHGVRDMNRPQLHRSSLKDRINMEHDIGKSSGRLLNFGLMLIFYLVAKCTYDPTETVNRLHMNLRRRFKMSELDSIVTHQDVMVYLQTFVQASYRMASALVDANTFEEIDFERCLDDRVSDVCRLKYWKKPLNQNEAAFFNITSFRRDVLAQGQNNAYMDCKSTPPQENCINSATSTDPNLERKTFGLTPEDPIILESRMDYVNIFAVPLAPIVWQSIAKKVDCYGFGSHYNQQVLGAGECQVNLACDSHKVTEFKHKQRNLNTGRRQSVFVTYSEHAFWCLDRSQYENEFNDTSWSPWATFENLKTGKSLEKKIVDGKPVFYKFFSDVAYLQKPFATHVHDDAAKVCREGGEDGEECGNLGIVDSCKDPLLDPAHPMWSEINNEYFRCSFHDLWSRNFLSATPDEWEEKRKNTFVRYNTNELTVAVLVISSFGEDGRDIATLVKVVFNFDESGNIWATNSMLSLSQTLPSWYAIAAITLVNAFIYFVFSLVDGRSRGFSNPLVIFDICQALTTMCLVSSIVVLDEIQDVTNNVLDALRKNTQNAYFECMMSVLRYNERSVLLSTLGFFNMIAIFFRLNLYLGTHPRLARLVRTVTAAADDMFHFFFYTIILVLFLCTLSWFSFGANEDEAYATWGTSLWRLFRMFTGDGGGHFPNGDKLPGTRYVIFFMLFWFVIFLILLNFFLAIVVNMYTAIQEEDKGFNVDKNFLSDYLDIMITFIARIWYGWATTADLRRYFCREGIAREISQATHIFKPGEMGVACDEKGFVEEVIADGAAVSKDIKKGNQVVSIGTLPYSKDVQHRAEKSGCKYEVTFQVGPTAVTAEELFHCVRTKDRKKAFVSLNAAREFVYFYADKVHHHSKGRVLLEHYESRCFEDGAYFGGEFHQVDVASEPQFLMPRKRAADV